MSASSFRTLGCAAIVAIAGCSTMEPPADLVAFQNQYKNQGLLAQAKQVAPKLVGAAEQDRLKAQEACEDNDQAECLHFSTMAKIRLETAYEQAATAAAKQRHDVAQQAIQAAQRAMGEQMALKSDYDKRIARMERVAQLQGTLKKTSSSAEAERMRMKIALEKQALEAKQVRKQYAVSKAKLDLLMERNALFEEAAAIVGPDNVKQTMRGIVVTVRDLFPSRKTDISEERIEIGEELARLVLKYPAYPVIIEGHTDSRGSNSGNLALSHARAQSIMKMFIDSHVPVSRVKAIGYGEKQPTSDNQTRSGRAANRRIDLKFLFINDPVSVAGNT